ncbi:MAG: OmpA family protein [Deltaproteobacteria bacterium]|nr:OmpA family protein [Deltaproteobacteria bacterium]
MRTKQTLLVAALTALLGGVATANTNVNFKFDSAALSPGAETALADVAAKAIGRSGQRVVLDGHADPVGASPYNVGLSLRRAEAVKDKLISLGVDSERIVISAYGEDKPAGATNAAKRRVRIWMTELSVNQVVAQAFASNGTSVHWDRPLTVAELDMPAGATDAVASR